MNKALLDTDIFSEIFKKINQNVINKGNAYLAEFERYTISVITVIEIVKGLHKKQQTTKLDTFLSQLSQVDVLTLDIESSDIAGRIMGELEKVGNIIGLSDSIIASIAIRHGITLVTGNTDHYTRIKELGYPLVLENWKEELSAT